MRHLIARALPLLALVLAAVALPATAQINMEEGKQYVRLKNPQPVESGNKIEVLEFFSYGCPHCAHLEPELEKWFKVMPPDVQFRRVPVVFQPAWEVLARVYYTLEGLGVDQKLSPDVFKAIHEQNINLAKDKTFFDWAEKHGLERKKVEDMYNSFGVVSKVNRARQLACGVQGRGGALRRGRRQVRDRLRQDRRSPEHAGRDRRAGRQGARGTQEVGVRRAPAGVHSPARAPR